MRFFMWGSMYKHESAEWNNKKPLFMPVNETGKVQLQVTMRYPRYNLYKWGVQRGVVLLLAKVTISQLQLQAWNQREISETSKIRLKPWFGRKKQEIPGFQLFLIKIDDSSLWEILQMGSPSGGDPYNGSGIYGVPNMAARGKMS